MSAARRVKLLLNVAAVLSLAGASLTANSASYGMNTHYLDSFTGSKMNELGAGFVRLDFNWNQIEADCKGCFNWGPTDSYVSQAGANGLFVFATLAYTPGWANGGAGINVPPSNYDDWYDFVREVVLRYSNSPCCVWFWGVWNEPNLSGFLAGSRAEQLAAYQQLAQRARDAVNSIVPQPTAFLVGPEVNHDGINDGFYRTVMQNFGFSTFDMVSVHIYGQYGNGIRSMMGGEVAAYRFGKDMWLTEVGLSSCSANQTSEEVQRAFYQDVLENGWNLRHPNWTKIFFYHLFDGATCSDAIIRPNQTNKPAFQQYKNHIAWFP